MTFPLSRCFEQNALPPLNATWLWLAVTSLLLVLLLALFALLFIRRNRQWLVGHYHPVDRWLSSNRLTAGAWDLLKSRFARGEWHGLLLSAGLVVAVLMVALFEEILEGWTDQDTLYRVDQAVHCLLTGALDGAPLAAVTWITHGADVIVVTLLGLILLGVLLVRREYWQALALFLAIGCGQAVVWGLKFLSARERPAEPLLHAAGASFPSAHAFAAIVFYGFVVFMIWQWTSRAWLRVLATVLLSLLIFAIAVSRVLLSVHWVSDVLGGLVIGLAWLMTSLVLARGWQAYRRRGTKR